MIRNEKQQRMFYVKAQIHAEQSVEDLLSSGEVNEAWELSKQLITRKDAGANTYNNHAVIGHMLGYHPQALAAINRARKMAPGDQNIAENFVSIHLNGQLDRENITLSEILRLAKEIHPDVLIKAINVLNGVNLHLQYKDERINIPDFNRRYALTSGPVTYCQDGLATVVESAFMEDERFLEAYQHGKETGSWGREVHWRMHTACWAANHARDLNGDFVECGVYKGGSALTVIEYIDFLSTEKTFWLLDTFEGVSMEMLTEEENRIGIGSTYNHQYENCEQQVREQFRAYPNVEIIKGPVPETLAQVTADEVSYLHIDMNNATPEIAAAEYFWDRLVQGGIMLLDDYAWCTHPIQKREFDKFADRVGVEILSMPTGQGMLIKQ